MRAETEIHHRYYPTDRVPFFSVLQRYPVPFNVSHLTKLDSNRILYQNNNHPRFVIRTLAWEIEQWHLGNQEFELLDSFGLRVIPAQLIQIATENHSQPAAIAVCPYKEGFNPGLIDEPLSDIGIDESSVDYERMATEVMQYFTATSKYFRTKMDDDTQVMIQDLSLLQTQFCQTGDKLYYVDIEPRIVQVNQEILTDSVDRLIYDYHTFIDAMEYYNRDSAKRMRDQFESTILRCTDEFGI